MRAGEDESSGFDAQGAKVAEVREGERGLEDVGQQIPFGNDRKKGRSEGEGEGEAKVKGKAKVKTKLR